MHHRILPFKRYQLRTFSEVPVRTLQHAKATIEIFNPSTSLTYIVWRLLNIENKITCCCCFFKFSFNFVAFIPRRVTVFCWEPYPSQNFVAYFLTFSLLTFAVAIADLPKESFSSTEGLKLGRNSRFWNFVVIIQTRLECQMEIDFPAATFSGYTLISGKERKIRLRVFTSYIGNAAP